ncbi:substrate-binding domain-containing protein [Flammeovirga yaeyamensis]|uniref:Substrate-binding domain-containing protein n=1 Tax=Flammeovirga yaeyamensis TaxID=367791 RepID=A0AAX1N7I5_9BACT|nr:LacI family DNA-binding transcriptional regulator [Flammeovirga yaeyamensis]MBB3700769.1 LacI family transcriptional regulator [Flammeovirga yaeyamensis]NMF37875.1 LacI family transcriptional regulator [Flammeovirga yaeyamensis]QWG01763.1 substrate-binding domain-containing protein [Flammeovirga yaeyamensis]
MGVSKSVGIKEIALMANVSVGTVDRVIHNRGRVSEATKEKIERLMVEHGYKHKKSTFKLFNIGILLPSPKTNPYWALPLQGLKDRAKVLTDSSIKITENLFNYNSADDYLKKGEELLSEHVDGLIIHPLFRQETYQIIRKVRDLEIPFVFLDANLPELEPTYFVGQDAKSCGGLAGRLLSLGLRKDEDIWIINLSSNSGNSTTFLREIGAVDTLKSFTDNLNQVKVLDINPSSNDDEILSIFKQKIDSNKSPSRVYVTNSKIGRVYKIIQKLDISDRIVMIGHDPLEENIKLLNSNKIDFLIAQDSKKQGALVLDGIHDFLLFNKLDEKEKHICSNVYSKENINSISSL